MKNMKSCTTKHEQVLLLLLLVCLTQLPATKAFISSTGATFSQRSRHVCHAEKQVTKGQKRSVKARKAPKTSVASAQARPKRGPKGQQSKKAAPRELGRRAVSSPKENRILNSKIVQQQSAMDILIFLAGQKGALTSQGSGCPLNAVNFSTALHRTARNIQYNNNNRYGPQNDDLAEKNDRSRVLSDPRFALFLCSLTEALAGTLYGHRNDPIIFGSRDLSNIAWAIAKLKIAPPQSTMAVNTSEDIEDKLKNKAVDIRQAVYEIARLKREGAPLPDGGTPWIPMLSELAGLTMDTISSRVVDVNPNLFRLQEWANLLWALATARRADEKVFDFVINSLITGMKTELDSTSEDRQVLSPQEWSNSVWALATSGILGPEEKLFPFVAHLLDEYPEFLSTFKPQELSNTIWGVATVLSNTPGQPLSSTNDAALSICRHIAEEVVRREGVGFKSQELTNTVWALATLGFGISSDTSQGEKQDYTFLATDDATADRELVMRTGEVVFDSAKQLIRKFKSQELNNLCWAMARLEMQDNELLELVGEEFGNPRRRVKSQDIGTTLWGMANCDFKNHDVYRKVVSRLTPAMAERAKPQELSNMLWALATADVSTDYVDIFDTTVLSPRNRKVPADFSQDPVISAFAFGAQELMRRPDEFKTQEIKDTLWAFSRNGIRHPGLFQAMAEHVVGPGNEETVSGRGLKDFSVQGMGNMAWAFARQAQLGVETIQRFKGKIRLPNCSGRLAHYTVLFTDVGESLIQKLFYNIAEADLEQFDNLKRLKPQDISNTAWAFAIVGLQHSRFLDAVGNELVRRSELYIQAPGRKSPPFSSQEVTNSVWALATLNYPIRGLLTALVPVTVGMNKKPMTSSSISRNWKRQELSNLAWCCAVFGEYPREMVEMLYMGLAGVGDKSDPSYLAQLYGDSGITPSMIMSLAYLQIAMDLEVEGNYLALPQGFPTGWKGGSTGSSSRQKSNMETQGMVDLGDLRLTRSKIQESVSTAFSRIGFNHVEEFVIDMEMLSSQYGIQMDPVNTEILSLDIANESDRLGIEVDGPGHYITNIDGGWLTNRGEVFEHPNGKLEYDFEWTSDTSLINGPTALKIRLLSSLGWRIHNIPFWEWADVNGDIESENDYCRKLVE